MMSRKQVPVLIDKENFKFRIFVEDDLQKTTYGYSKV